MRLEINETEKRKTIERLTKLKVSTLKGEKKIEKPLIE